MSLWNINTAEFVVLRTPLLPEKTTNTLNDEQSNIDITKNITKSLSQLKLLCQQSNIVQAIEFASPSLAKRINELSLSLETKNLKLAASIYKYIVRMSTRCTPFGAFSSVMTLPVKDDNHLNINPDIRLYVRLDNSCVIELAQLLESKAINRRNLNLRLKSNNSLYKLGDDYRYVANYISNFKNSFSLDSIKYTEAINIALSLTNQWITVKSLASKMSKHFPDSDKSHLIDFIFNLIENQILCTDLTLVVSSSNSLEALLDRVKNYSIDADILKDISRILKYLSLIQSNHDKKNNEYIVRIKKLLEKLIPNHNLKKWIHVDSFRDAKDLSYSRNYIKPIIRTINSLSDFFWKPNKSIQNFTIKFEEMYGDSEVPLLEALDIDTGIPFGQKRSGRSPLLKGVLPSRASNNLNIEWDGLSQYILEKIIEAVSNSKNAVEINSAELEKFKSQNMEPQVTFNESFSILGTVLEENNSNKFLLKSVRGPSSLSLLGRFCCGDSSLLDYSRNIAKKEQSNNKDVVYAEIIHIPQSEIANISCRPALRDYEISYGLGDSSKKCEKQIPCSDLYLKVSSGRLCLFSKKLGKEIKPRLASAHNTAGLNLPVYQFLHALQSSDGFFSNIQLNKVFNTLPYLPEIRIDNLIISQSRWLITPEDLQKIKKCSSIKEKIESFNELKINKKISRYIAITEGDNVLEFDLESAMSILFFVNEIVKKHSTIIVTQSLKNRTDSSINHNSSVYRHEVVIPAFVEAKTKNRAPIRFNVNSVEKFKLNTSIPGEHWKYLKIYTGEACADTIISEYLAPLANELVNKKHIQNWHYIRYGDPDFHLRIRFKLNQTYQTNAINKKVSELLKNLYKKGLIKKLVEDCYVPEINRYGGENLIATCEELFYINSVVTCKYIEATKYQENKDELRWMYCLRLIWQITFSICGSLESMEDFFKKNVSSYDDEFNMNQISKKRLSQNYRDSIKKISQSLSVKSFDLLNHINYSEQHYYTLKIKELKELSKRHNKEILPILQSIIHMDCNRIFVLNQRANEWIIYHYLARYTRTAIARKLIPGIDVLSGFESQQINERII